MKRLFSLLLTALLLAGSAAADPIDLSGMSFDELVALRDQLNLAIWNSQEWQEVTIPAGIWIVGKDIPVGHWNIKVASETDYQFITYFNHLDSVGLGPDYSGYFYQQQIASSDLVAYGVGCPESVSIDARDGWYIQCTGAVIFTPYAGKPDLGFK